MTVARTLPLLTCAFGSLALVTGPAHAYNWWAASTTPLVAKTDGSARWHDDAWSPWGWTRGTTGLPGEADYARGKVRVCEDQNNSPDDCSGWAYSKGSAY